jgi:DNA-binding ferritin-like protein
MYRRVIPGQDRLDLPFGVELRTDNRWVQFAAIIPWEKIEKLYQANFTELRGQVAKPSRLVFGALFIQWRLGITDEETVDQIRENPSMQFFCGFESYTTVKPFDSSLMVHFRKRITSEMMKEITEAAFAAEAKKAIESEDDDGDDNGSAPSGGDGNNSGAGESDANKNKGTMLLDATCHPADIKYPTDTGLLNHARELTERIIDELHEQLRHPGYEKPRTYREVARKDFLRFEKRRKPSQQQIRNAIRKQLQYLKRNLETINEQIEQGATLKCIGEDLQKKLETIRNLYSQQKQMYDERTHKVDNRIVSIAQPWLRPIVRGKANAAVEFGAKVATARIGGFSFIIHMDYKNFPEAQHLKESAEEYRRIFGFYPKVIIGDKIYGNRNNRDYCKSKGIRLSGPGLGRKSEDAKEAEKEQMYRDSCKRNAIEGDYGTEKRKYGMDRIKAKLDNTTLTAISVGNFVKNAECLRKKRAIEAAKREELRQMSLYKKRAAGVI